MPDHPLLAYAAQMTGLIGPGMVGLTLGYGVFVCEGHDNSRLVAHELRHVYQYERVGSISKFLEIYLQQIAAFGYQDAPLEIDARAHEHL